MAGKVFISYSKEQPEPTRALAEFLTAQGYSVWWDTNLSSGERFHDVIDREMNTADAVIVIWTEHSITSKWVMAEADDADRVGKLVTVRTKDIQPWRIPKPFNIYHADVVDDHAAILTSVRRVAGEPVTAKPQAPAPGPSLSDQTVQEAVALEYWQSIKDTADAAGLRAYLAEFRKSRCAPLALARLRAQASAAWKRVNRKSEAALTAFLAQWPEAVEREEARMLVDGLKSAGTTAAAEAETSEPATSASELTPAASTPGSARKWIMAGGAAAVAVAAIVWLSQANKPARVYVPPPPPPAPPGVSLPELGSRMADETRVKDAIKRATAALGSTGKKPYITEAECERDARARDIHRGMILSLAGYYLVIWDLRTGNYDHYGYLPSDYDQLDRSNLFSYWTPARVTAAWRASNALSALSADDKKSISAFLAEIKSSKDTYLTLKTANVDFDAYVDPEVVADALKKARKPPLNKCLSAQLSYELTWKVTPSGGTSSTGFPAYYMINFWYRRDQEGQMGPAESFLNTMIGLLR